MLEGSLTDCTFAGRLNIPSVYAAKGPTCIGGLAANIGGSHTGYPGNGALIQVLDFNNTAAIMISGCNIEGDIDITDAETGVLYLGGAAGWIEGDTVANNITFSNCEYRNGGTVTIASPNANGGSIGGFGGDVVGNAMFNNCRVLAASITITWSGGNVGGFAGVFRGNIENCYTNTALNVTNSCTGGFIGVINTYNSPDSWTIENCYAVGSVTTQSTSSRDLYTGGFIGGIGAMPDNLTNTENWDYVLVKNCYALGTVTADKIILAATGDVYAGGFVGYMNILTANALEYCFAAGAVLAKSNGSGAVYAGGVVGYKYNGILRYSAVLGSSVTAQGGGSRFEGRVYGDFWTSGGGSSTGNYALIPMVIEEDSSYSTYTPVTRAAVSNDTGKDGANAAASAFRSQSIWTGALGFAAPSWNFATVSRGYPTLAGLGGQ
jgi:hypothetical protein